MTVILIVVILSLSWWIINIIYSVFLSPLKHIPSPWIFQIFPGYFTLSRVRGASPFLIHQYHLQYGPVFRVGWNRVLFISQEASQIIYGTHKCIKALSYEGFSYFGETLFSTRDRNFHSRRKLMVAPAFTKNSVANMEPAIHKVAIKPLLKRLQPTSNPIDIYRLLHYASWDIIGELAFGKSFDMLTKGGDHPVVDWVKKANKFSMLGALLPAIKHFKFRAGENLTQFSHALMDNYFQRQPSNVKDNIISHFIQSDNNNTLTRDEVFSEAVLMLFAGTDTTSNTLTWIVYLLITHPHIEAKVVEELSLVEPDVNGAISYDQCNSKLLYLQAVIKEALRILPAAPGTPVRVVPAEGLTIDGYYLPGGTECAVPIYSLHRSPNLWSNPDKFLPERWLKHPNHLNYMPFLMGPRACIGKHLAWVELLVIISSLYKHFSFQLAQPKINQMFAAPILRPFPEQLLVHIKPRSL